jgi:hypothetical protein
VASDGASESRLGILQHYVRVGARNEVRLNEHANSLLRIHNRDEQSLNVSGAIGDVRVRGGSLITLGLSGFSGTAGVKRCLHRLSDNRHLMDLELEVGL